MKIMNNVVNVDIVEESNNTIYLTLIMLIMNIMCIKSTDIKKLYYVATLVCTVSIKCT